MGTKSQYWCGFAFRSWSFLRPGHEKNLKSKKEELPDFDTVALLYYLPLFTHTKSEGSLVEVKGVEPLSEHIAIQLSPSADSILYFAPAPPADRLRHR